MGRKLFIKYVLLIGIIITVLGIIFLFGKGSIAEKNHKPKVTLLSPKNGEIINTTTSPNSFLGRI